MTELIIGLISVIVSVLWAHIVNKLNKNTEQSEMLHEFILASSKEIQELYKAVMALVKEKAKDGVIDEEDKATIISFARIEAKKRGITLVDYLAPKVYKSMLEKMIEVSLKK